MRCGAAGRCAPSQNRTRTIGQHRSRWVTHHSAKFANPNMQCPIRCATGVSFWSAMRPMAHGSVSRLVSTTTPSFLWRSIATIEE